MIRDDEQQETRDALLQDQLNTLKRESDTLYNILAVDVWAIAKTMDEFQPGFWDAFMKNRQQAVQRFLEDAVKSKTTDLKRPPFLQ